MPKGVYLVFPKSEFRPPEFHPSLMFAYDYVVVIDLIQYIVIAYRHFIYLYNSFC
jgi:hypothetical protein